MANRARRKGKKPLKRYDPMAPRFKYQRGFNRAVKRQARSQIDPALNDIKARTREAQGAHDTRTKELGGWFGNEATQAQAGYDRLNTSLQSLMGSTSGYEGDASGALNAALRQQAQGAQAEAQKLGVNAAPVDPSFLATSQAYGDANKLGLTGDIAGLLGSSAAGIGTAGIRGREAGVAEDDRFSALIKGLQGERSDVMGTLPGLRDQARASIGQEELGRAGQAFQQSLAGKQFGLDRSRFGEEKKQNRFQRGLARRTQTETERSNKANEGNSRYSAHTQRQELQQAITDAKNKEEADRAKLEAEGFDNGIAAIDEFVKPQKWELNPITGVPDPKKTARDGGQALDILMRRNGLSKKTALKVLDTYPQFRKFVKASRTKIKKKARKKAKKLVNPFD